MIRKQAFNLMDPSSNHQDLRLMKSNLLSQPDLNTIFKEKQKEIQCLKPQLLRILVLDLPYMQVWNLHHLLAEDLQQE